MVVDPSTTVFDSVIWSGAKTGRLGGLVEAVWRSEQIERDRSTQITVDTVFTDSGHPFDLVEPKNLQSLERISLATADLLQLEDDDGLWVLSAWATGHEGVFHLVSSVPTTHPRWERVERWIGAARGVMRCFLNHVDFEGIGDALGEVEVGRMTARTVFDGSSISRGWPHRLGVLRPTHREAIREAEERLASVRTLTLHVHDRLSVHLRRLAGATFYNGDFAMFEEVVLSRLAASAAGRRSLMMNRQRRPAQPARPITIRLSQALLNTADETARVIAEIDSLPKASLAVFHRNPYLHLVITDEVDGSNFDVMVTKSDAIDIYPGYRASTESLTRLAQRLGERFAATEIAETVKALVALEDLANG